MRRIIKIMNSIRQELEISVISTNRVLKDAVKSMDYIQLLRNVHPLYRPDYAHRLFKEGIITVDETKEFTKIIGK